MSRLSCLSLEAQVIIACASSRAIGSPLRGMDHQGGEDSEASSGSETGEAARMRPFLAQGAGRMEQKLLFVATEGQAAGWIPHLWNFDL